MAFRKRDDLIIEHAEIGYSDFKGSRYGSSFMILMNRGEITYKGIKGYKDIQELIKDGWPIKQSTREDQEDEYVMWVNVKFDVPDGMVPPVVYTETGKKKEKLDDETIGLLDNADILNVDVRITPSVRRDGNGYTAYVKTMFVTLFEDPLMDAHGMYEDIQQPEDADDIPF
jgi:hypothetical protein